MQKWHEDIILQYVSKARLEIILAGIKKCKAGPMRIPNTNISIRKRQNIIEIMFDTYCGITDITLVGTVYVNKKVIINGEEYIQQFYHYRDSTVNSKIYSPGGGYAHINTDWDSSGFIKQVTCADYSSPDATYINIMYNDRMVKTLTSFRDAELRYHRMDGPAETEIGEDGLVTRIYAIHGKELQGLDEVISNPCARAKSTTEVQLAIQLLS